MALLVQSGKYGVINTTGTTTHEFYVIMFISEAYTLQDNTTIGGQIITASGLVSKSKYPCSMQADTNWYWNKYPQQRFITVPTSTIINPRLEVNAITDIHDKPQIVCTRTQTKNPYQDILYVLLIMTMITSSNKSVV